MNVALKREVNGRIYTSNFEHERADGRVFCHGIAGSEGNHQPTGTQFGLQFLGPTRFRLHITAQRKQKCLSVECTFNV